MKNLPERKFWNEVRSRLQNYTEEPDENWNLIAARIPSNKTGWMDTSGHLLTTAALLSFLFLLMPGHPFDAKLLAGSVLHNEAVGTFEEKRIEDPIAMQNHFENGERKDEAVVKNSVTSKRLAVTSKRNGQEAPAMLSQLASDGASILSEESSLMQDVAIDQPLESVSPIGKEMSQSTNDVNENRLIETIKSDTAVIVSTTTSKKKKKSFPLRPQVYATITPTLSYYKIDPEKNDNLLVTQIHQDGMTSADRLGFQFEAGFQQPISKSFDIFAGISLTSQHMSLTYDYVTNDVEQIMSSDELSYTLSPRTATRSVNLLVKSAGVTAGIFYILKRSRLSHRLGAGMQYQRASLSYDAESRSGKATTEFVNYMLLYRIQLAVSRKFDLYIQPGYSHSLTQHSLFGEQFQVKPYKVGVGFGVVYRF